MVFEIAVNMQTLIPWIILMAGLVYETTMFIYRKAVGGEQFSLEKYALTYGYVGLLAVVAYLATGVIPGVSDIMVQLTTIPEYTAVLPLVFAVIMGLFQQGSKSIRASKTVAATPSITPATGDNIGGGRGHIPGIYAGTAAGATPTRSITFDVNAVPSTFFDLIGTEVGPIALMIKVDGDVLKKWSPNNDSDSGVFTAKIDVVGKRMPFMFDIIYANAIVPGMHIINISTGQFKTDGTLGKWLTSDSFTINITGTKPLE